MSIAVPAVNAARTLATNPAFLGEAASVAGSVGKILPEVPKLSLASDTIRGISPITMAWLNKQKNKIKQN